MTRLLMLIAIVAASLLPIAAGQAHADDCVALGGAINGGECQISVNVNASGTFNLDETLHILGTGGITVPPAAGGNTLTINLCIGSGTACDLVMDAGSKISGNVASGPGATITVNASDTILLNGGAVISSDQTAGGCAAGHGGNVNLAAVTGITIQAGAVISTNAVCSAGAISLIATQGSIVQNGSVLSESTISGLGAQRRPGGGPITVIARCDLSVGGKVSSMGKDPGSDLVHLEGGCAVTITGLVQSTGPGHGVPNFPWNHCFGPDPLNPSRPDKPSNSTSCVEIWAGNSLFISSTAEINADTGGTGGNGGTGWIDLFARGSITITGDAVVPFAVHANGNGGSGGGGEIGGIVTVKSKTSTVTASGKALQANVNNNASNSTGGSVTVQAASAVTLDGATIEATIAGSGDTGGTIAVRSFQGALSWQAGVGDVRPNATGTITLEACGAITTAGGDFNGEVPASTTPSCAVASPTLPDYVVLPDCICGGLPSDGLCPEDAHRLLSRTVDPTGTQHGLLPNHLTLQDAVDAASSPETIGVFGNTDENVIISNKKLIITQCTLAKITAGDGTKPVVEISSPDQIIVIGLDTLGGTVGWSVKSSGHELRAVRATGASQFGILVGGNSNKITWNNVSQCGVGIKVTGNTNDLRGGTVELNTGDGVQIEAPATGNTLQGATVQNNGGNGIAVSGPTNTIKNNSRIDKNTLNGVLVSGTGNTISGNTAGSSAGLGNTQDGFKVVGAGNTLSSNKASNNRDDGFDISGGGALTANILKGNQSNQGSANGNRENTVAEYRLLGTVKSQGSNKADGITVPKLGAPQKCVGFPLSGQTKTFAPAFVCE